MSYGKDLSQKPFYRYLERESLVEIINKIDK